MKQIDDVPPRLLLLLATVAVLFGSAGDAFGTPQFARMYGIDSCTTCHVVAPKLNAYGESFLARGYRVDPSSGRGLRPTVPLALWITSRQEEQVSREFSELYLNRVELISGGPLGELSLPTGDAPLSYFVEWRLISLETRGDGTLRDRSGRFEDAFINLGLSERFGVTVGQFRALNQIDVSRRLSLSEPAAFSTSLPGDPSSNPRIQSLRGFSPAGRSPGVALSFRSLDGDSPSDGLFHRVTVPFVGEFSLPVTPGARDEASFELQGPAKGVFLETYYRHSCLRTHFWNRVMRQFEVSKNPEAGQRLWGQGLPCHLNSFGGSCVALLMGACATARYDASDYGRTESAKAEAWKLRATTTTAMIGDLVRGKGQRPDGAPHKSTAGGIQDNSFFIEEAYNQEPNVVQHIFNAVWAANERGAADERGWFFAFTQEWPLFSQTHQLSYTVPYSLLESGGESVDGLGDVKLNYRFQALMETALQPAFAPRISLLVPTGNEDQGMGSGVFGYEVNLPVSKVVSDRWTVHGNAGMTIFADVEDRNLVNYNFGASAVYAANRDLNLMLELICLSEQTLAEAGRLERDLAVILSPGIRHALNLDNDLQVVVGVAVPVGLTADAPDYGIFLYLSFEHPFGRRPR